MKPILSAHELHAGYDNRAVVRNLNLAALPGQVICVIGPNGAGKSTILRTLAGLLPPVQGEVRLGGENIRQVKPALKAKEIAVVLTEKIALPMTSAFELAAMGRTPHTGFFGKLSPDDRRIVHECLRLVGAANLAERRFSSLSDGEKQKVMIARALCQEPRIIILDEPTSHLDIKHKVEVIRILNRLAREKGLTVILSMHDIDLALKTCQIMLLVKDGKVAACGAPEEIIGEHTIEKFFELDGASYDPLLGALECHGAPQAPSGATGTFMPCLRNEIGDSKQELVLPQALVVAGGGTGTPVYRLLSRLGFAVTTGILHQNDIDFRLACALKLTVLSAESFNAISPAAVEAAQSLVQTAAFIIDSGFPVGAFNQENIFLLQAAATAGRRILSLRPPAEVAALYGTEAPSVSALRLSELQVRVRGEEENVSVRR
ncbi:MAG: ABC transporter ATP-binding protein [Spirochaetaceae bacterium]|jgi:iron complex transport system ATP-binding protein|nr:ABC transporter ATP-binding protein [Spirochaetaceae bacterium]